MSDTRVAIIGDVHAAMDLLDRMLGVLAEQPSDLVVLTGDLTRDPASVRKKSFVAVLDAVCDAMDAPVVYVPGNHDLRRPPGNERAENIDGERVERAGLTVAGFGGAGPARFGFPYEWSEVEAEGALMAAFGPEPEPVDIFLSHTPPVDTTLDVTHHGSNVGSSAVRRWIGVLRPRLFVCGHIHEAWGVETVDGFQCLNAGSLGPPFGQAIAWLVGWSDGGVDIECLRLVDGELVTQRFPGQHTS